jgi:hypothetical protein
MSQLLPHAHQSASTSSTKLLSVTLLGTAAAARQGNPCASDAPPQPEPGAAAAGCWWAERGRGSTQRKHRRVSRTSGAHPRLGAVQGSSAACRWDSLGHALDCLGNRRSRSPASARQHPADAADPPSPPSASPLPAAGACMVPSWGPSSSLLPPPVLAQNAATSA